MSWWTNLPKIWCDLDGVLIDFEDGFRQKFGIRHHPKDWNDFGFRENFGKIVTDESFWLNLSPLCAIGDIPFPFEGYCTSRAIPAEVTEQWLKNHRFPKLPLLVVRVGASKVAALQENGCELFIDDSIYNFMELQNHGIPCLLKTRPHNERFDVGDWRIHSLKEVLPKIEKLKL